MSNPSWRRSDARALVEQQALRQSWDALNLGPPELPFLSAAAVVAALQNLGQGTEQLVWAEVSGRVAFMAVLVPQDRWRWSSYQPSQIPLGCWVADRSLPLQAWAQALLHSGCLGFPLSVSLTQADPLRWVRQQDSAQDFHEDYVNTAWLDIEGTFDAYWAQRGKNLRQNLRKQRNKLASDNIVPTLKVWRRPEDVAAAIARYGAMESLGWKSDQGTAIHPDNAQGRFYTQLLADAASQNQTLITEYCFNDRPVAMNLGLLSAGTWVVLKTTYDETVSKTLSPSSLLREEELQLLFAGELPVKRIEYYGRVMDWHTKLTDHQRSIYHLTRYRWAWLKQLALKRRRRSLAALEPAPASTSTSTSTPAPGTEPQVKVDAP